MPVVNINFVLQPMSVGTLPLPMQELAIVEDLLFLMMVRVSAAKAVFS